jgi:signal transduction histidine kinase/ActR/RegA family two-component response regulator/HPt (histidine-containing phosphotransfer) domain-containing protein
MAYGWSPTYRRDQVTLLVLVSLLVCVRLLNRLGCLQGAVWLFLGGLGTALGWLVVAGYPDAWPYVALLIMSAGLLLPPGRVLAFGLLIMAFSSFGLPWLQSLPIWPRPPGGDTDNTVIDFLVSQAGSTAIAWFMARFRQDLVQANELSRRHEAARSRFLARMSHEVRTPLHGMLGMAHLLSLTPVDARQQELLDAMQHAGMTLQALVNDVLDLAKIEAVRLELRRHPFNLHAVCHEVVEPMRLQARARDVSLSLAIDPDVPEWVAGDAVRVRQILANLVGNALKFTEAGTIRVTLQPGCEGPERVRLSVADTGPGIEAGLHDAIFSEYTQALHSPIEGGQGTGLGLAICRHLTELMGGRIWVESQPRQGSTFVAEVSLPRAERPQVPSAPLPQHHPLRILICDDDPLSRLFLQDLLDGRGHDVVAVATGREAVQVALADAFDVAIWDVQTPGLNGLQATQHLRDHEGRFARQPLPIVGLTADTSPETAAACREAGMQLVLAKPLQVDGLFDALTTLGFAYTPGSGQGQTPAWQVVWPTGSDPDPAFLRIFFDTFLREAPRLMADLTLALQAGDRDCVGCLAHRLAGMLGNLHADSLVDLARWVECHPDTPETAGQVTRLAAGLQELCRSVTARRDGLPDQPPGTDSRST